MVDRWGGEYIREFIVQWNRDGLDLFEYTKEHCINLIFKKTYATEIIHFLKHVEDKCFVHIEYCPIFHFLNKDLLNENIENNLCYDAERWLRYEWREKIPHVIKYIAYWECIKPSRVDDLEQREFTVDLNDLLRS